MLLFYLILTIWQVLPSGAAPVQDGDGQPFLANDRRQAAPTGDPYLAAYAPAGTRTLSDRSAASTFRPLAVIPPFTSYRENYAPVAVVTVSQPTGVVQILPPPTGPLPNTIGTCISTLETGGRPSTQPIITASIPSPTVTFPSTQDPKYADAATSSKMEYPTAQYSANLADIFGAPIASSAPPTVFPVRSDHPAPRIGIKKSGPIGTNKFYGNFFLGTQSAPTFLHPYSVAWAKGQGATSSWGMCVSHIEASQRVFGPPDAATGASRYFINPIGIQSLCLSAVELGSTTTLTSDSAQAQSININLQASSNATPMITFPLVQGMGFVTAVYRSGTPVISTGVFFKTVTRSNQSPKPGVTKYTMYLLDGKVWHVYAYAQSGPPLNLQVVNNGLAKSTQPFTGFIQIAKDPGNAEQVLDAACAAYPVGVTLSGTAVSKQGTYSFRYKKAGDQNTRLLMFALPHHISSFDSATSKAVNGQLTMQTTTKGQGTAVIADSWTMVEPNMPITMGFAPWDPVSGPKNALKDSAISTIRPNALKEISQDMDAQANQNSMYFAGKALAKFASICYAVNDLLKDTETATTGLNNLKAAFSRFTQNRQQFPLYFETAWGGVVSSATYTTGNNGADFGNTFYNDHHFHYGYHILTAAIIGYLDPTWLTRANVDYINTLVRDISNPTTKDKYFPVSRMFDWYHGHSWAHGLYESYDGKDQESSSEDTMHAYAIKMWGRTIKDANMEARGNLMLSVLARSLNQYYLYTVNNKVQPGQFIGNKVAGILFENKIDHTTYFGTNIEYIQGIHMLPLLPSTKLTRPAAFVKQEWKALFNNGRAAKVEGGWRGILYGNLATVDAKSAWKFFTKKDFSPSYIDGGASLTWYQAYAAAFM